MKCNSIAQCKDVASFENEDVFNELGRAFKPWENGFSVFSITAGGEGLPGTRFQRDREWHPGVIVNNPCEI